ncbi:U-box domain-containing protein 28-like [Pyrus ussuriensis x Pyrus communis]|uniref:U-box domain-containing protein 28-like n=1 Tax=Pyrus ussuriensis x Pyrus communis TaxID=2448454 RepID=A0A5N5GNR8_9ROSA|nr:U-box domain-containing protein 28-like [Pyrus ussuriensis x Pyrus communis]
MFHSIVSACSIVVLNTFSSLCTILDTYLPSSHIFPDPSFTDEVVSSTFNTFSTVAVVEFESHRNLDSSYTAFKWINLTFTLFGVDRASKQERLTSMSVESSPNSMVYPSPLLWLQ